MKTIEYPLTVVVRKFKFDEDRTNVHRAYELAKEFAIERRLQIHLDYSDSLFVDEFFFDPWEFEYMYDIKDERLAIEFEKKVGFSDSILVSSFLYENYHNNQPKGFDRKYHSPEKSEEDEIALEQLSAKSEARAAFFAEKSAQNRE